MITLTLEMDFPESENAKILQKLSELLEKNNKVKVKELRVGEKFVDSLTAPSTINIPSTSPYFPTITWTCSDDLINQTNCGDHYSATLCENSVKFDNVIVASDHS